MNAITRFSSLGAFGAHLLTLQVAELVELNKGLKECAELVETTAKDEIGAYQPAVGAFGAWPELADSTKKDRLNKGFTENDPLLRTGELRDSISHELDLLEAVIGSDSDIMVYQEMGTDRIPPRAVLGPALIRNETKIYRILGEATMRGLLGGVTMEQGLGYDFNI